MEKNLKNNSKVEKKSLCKNCDEICCERCYVQLSKDELPKFKKVAKKIKGMWFIHPMGKHCPFYLKNKGCKLKYTSRPLSCKIYPFTFCFTKKGKPRLYLNRNCALHKFVKSDQITNLIKDARAKGFDKEIAITEEDNWP